MYLDRVIIRKNDPYQVRMAKSAAWLYWLGILVMLAGTTLPVEVPFARQPVLLLAAAGLVATVALVLVPWQRLSYRIFYLLAALACAHIATSIYFSGGAESPYGLLYFLIAIWAAYFFPFAGFALVSIFIIISSLAPVAYDEHFQTAHLTSGLTNILFLLIAGGVVNLLVAQLRTRGRELKHINTRLDQQIREGRREQEKTRAVIESVADGVYVIDNNRRVVLWNHGAVRITGYPEKEMIGRVCCEKPSGGDEPEECPPICDIAARIDEGASGVNYEVLSRHRQGQKIWLNVSAALIRDPDGSIVGIVHVFRDVSEHKQVDRMRSEFVATVSHELRTPLTSILGFSKTLLRQDVDFSPESRQSFLMEIVREGERLARLIEDVLSVSRIEAGSLQLDLKPTDPLPTVQQVVRHMSQLTGIHALIVDVPDNLPRVMVDADRLYQVLLNLVVNAVKYSPEGGRIGIAASREEDMVRFLVSDQGVGISEEHLPHIFDRFYRAIVKGMASVTGTGLGLYVSRSLVEEMGGRIWVESEPGEGSRFFFELPVANISQAEAAGAPAS